MTAAATSEMEAAADKTTTAAENKVSAAVNEAAAAEARYPIEAHVTEHTAVGEHMTLPRLNACTLCVCRRIPW